MRQQVAVALIGFVEDHGEAYCLSVGETSERRRSWRTEIALECPLHRRTGKTIEAQTLDLGPGGMRVKTNRPLAVDEMLEFELPERARINGRARVVASAATGCTALRFEKLGDEARAEIALLARKRRLASRSRTMIGISRSVFFW